MGVFASSEAAAAGDDEPQFSELQCRLERSGLARKQCALIVGVDFSLSNADPEHCATAAAAAADEAAARQRGSVAQAPSIVEDYSRAMRAIGVTLCPFMRENVIQCYGFGDVECDSAVEDAVFSFGSDRGDDEVVAAPLRTRRDLQLTGAEGALQRYHEIAPHATLGREAPSIAAVLRRAADAMVLDAGRVAFHALVILTAGPLLSGGSAGGGERTWEDELVDALRDVAKRRLPLSIVVVMLSNLAEHVAGSSAHAARAEREEAAWACIQRVQIRIADEVSATTFSPPVNFVRVAPRPDLRRVAADALRQLPEHFKSFTKAEVRAAALLAAPGSGSSGGAQGASDLGSCRTEAARCHPVAIVPRPAIPAAQSRSQRMIAWSGWRNSGHRQAAPVPSAPPAPPYQ